jgi:AcrR family transcriptional regulator
MRAEPTKQRPAGGATRKRAEHLGPERRRPLVLDAAFELFLERGYEGTSMASVAEAAGVTKPVVYACFPSKDELFKALLQREEERVLREIAAALPQDADLDDPEHTLIEAFTGFLRAVAEAPEAYRVIFLGEGGGNAAVARRVQRGRELQVGTVTTLVLHWLNQSGAHPDREPTARLIAQLIVGLAESGARAMLSDPDAWTPETLGAMLGRFAAAAQRAL